MPSDTTNTETQDRDALLFLKDATEADTKMTSEFCNEFEMSRSETVVKDMKEQPVTTCDRLSLEFHGMKIMKTPVSKVIGNSGLANAKYNSPLGSRTVRSSSSVRSGLRRARVSPQSSPNNTDVVKTPDDHENYDVKLNKPQDYKTNNFNGKSCKWDYDYLNNISKGLIIYPLIYVSPAGTISAILSHDLIIEMSVDRSLRIVHHDHFVAFINSSGSSSALLHHRAKIVHTKDTIFSKFTSTTDKIAVLDSDGVLFTMSHLSEAFLMNSFIRGVSAIPVDKLDFPSSMKNDFTLKMFYADAQTGNQFMILCNEIVDQAMHQRKPDGTLIMHVNGLSIKSQPSGYISIDNKARHFSYTPGCETINLRTSHADIGLQTNEKAFVKSGTKRVHVSKSGMVVSDGNSVTSMDQFGQILSGASILRR